MVSLSVTPQHQAVICNITSYGSATEFLIFYYQSGSTIVKSISSTSSNNIRISNLTNGQTYFFYASVYHSSYSSGTIIDESNKVSSIPSDLPTQPNLSSSVSTSGNDLENTIQLNWTESTCSYEILHYKIYLDSVLLDTTNQTFYTVSNLNYGQAYRLEVSALSIVGESSKARVNATPVSVPSAPSNLIINYDESNVNSVDLQWSASASSNGSDIQSYTILYSLDPTFQSGVSTVSSTSLNDTLMDAQLIIPHADRTTSTGWFYFKVCAVNSIGQSQFSSISTISVSELPVQIQSLSASNLDSSGNNSSGVVTLNWTYAIDAACPLLGYIISYLDPVEEDLDTIFVQNTSTNVSFTISGLQDGTLYDFNVYAINSLGIGPGSDIQLSPSTVSDVPEHVAIAYEPEGQTLILLWYDPTDLHGLEINSYNIYRSSDDISYSLISSETPITFRLSTSPNLYKFIDTNVINGTRYYYKITASNDNGESNFSSMVTDYPSTIPS